MGKNLTGIASFNFTQFHITFGICGGIHKNYGAGLRNWLGQFWRKLVTSNDVCAGQVQRNNGFRDFWPDAIVAAQRVAVADDKEQWRL